jgi:E3 ubiquitin-protein ligase BRE1
MFHKKKLLEKRKREEQEQVTTPIDIKNEHPTTKKIKSESVPSSPITPLTPRQVYRQQSDGNFITRTKLEQRKNLTAKVKAQDNELHQLRNLLSSTENNCKQYQEAVDFLSRLWNNMNEDLKILLKRLPFAASPSQPFRNLYTTNGLDTQNSSFTTCSQYCEQAKQLVQLLVDNIISSNKKIDDLIYQVKNGSYNLDHVLIEDNNRLKRRSDELEEQLIRMQNDYRLMSDRAEKLTNSNQRLSDELEQKKAELNEKKEELRYATQKIEKLKLDLQYGSVLIPNGSAQPQPSNSQSTSKAIDSLNDDRTSLLLKDMQVQIDELNKTIANRESQLNEKIDQISKLQQENQRMKLQTVSENLVIQSAPYKQLQYQFHVQLCNLEQEAIAKNDLLTKQEELKKLHKDEIMLLRKQLGDIISEYQMKENVLSNELVRLRQQVADMDIQLKNERENANKADAAQKKYDELQKRYEKKRKDFDNLLKDHEKVKKQVEKVQKQLQDRENEEKNDSSTVSDIEALKNELRTTKEQLQDKIEETQMYATELEEISASFNRVQEQNTKQKKQLDQKELRITELLKEQIEMKRLNDTYELKLNSMKQMCEAVERQLHELEAQVKAYKERADASEQTADLKQQEIIKLQLNFEKLRTQFKLKDAKVAELTSELERLKRALDAATVRAEETQTKYNKSSNEAKIYKEKIETLERRLKVMSTLSATKDLESELADYKKMATCSVCQVRTRNVTIQRCHHTFCADCIQSNLKVRNRKCPVCQEKYGNDDVKPIYL